MLPELLAFALLYVVAAGVVQLLAALPVAAAAESLPEDNPDAAGRFWSAASLLAPASALPLTAACLLLARSDMVTPHLERVRPHICAHPLLERPDADWHFRVAGIIALSLIAFALARFLWRWVSSVRVERLAAAHTGEGEVPVLVAHGDEPACFTVGLHKGFVIVSRGMVELLSDQQRKALIAHETAHVRRRDNLRHLVLELCATLSALAPIGFLYAYRWRAAAEAACDRAAAQVSSPETVAETLQLVEQATGGHRPEWPEGLNPVYYGGVSPTRRVARLTTPTSPQVAPPLKVVLAAEAIVLFAVTLLARRPLLDSLFCAGETVLKGMGG